MAFVLMAALAIRVVIGSFAGYVGGKTELSMISVIDIALALPSLVIALALMGVFSGENFSWMSDYWKMIVALTLAWWANYARISRAVVVAELQQPYIEAARVMGASHIWIFTRHILPHVLGLVVVYASADAGALVLAIATLSFLGLGVAPPTPKWAPDAGRWHVLYRREPGAGDHTGLGADRRCRQLQPAGRGLRPAKGAARGAGAVPQPEDPPALRRSCRKEVEA